MADERDGMALEVTAAITLYMRKNKITRRELAGRLGVTPGRVSQILSGGQNLTVRTLETVAEALDARIDLSLVPLGKG